MVKPRKEKADRVATVVKRLSRLTHLEGGKLLAVFNREIDYEIENMCNSVVETIDQNLDSMSSKLDTLEVKMARIAAGHEVRVLRANQTNDRLIDVERVEKKIMCQWLNSFLVSAGGEPQLDPVDFAFSRFALNIAVSADKAPVQKMLDARIPSFLVGMLSSSNEIVLGPAALALFHLTLHNEALRPIVEAGVIPPLSRLLRNCPAPAVLTQVCKIFASLGRHNSYKTRIAGEDGVAALSVLITESIRSEFMDVVRCTDGVLAAALSALVNVTHASASNQNLLVELNGVEPAIIACKKNSDSHVLEQAARLIGNTCFNNTYTGEQILSLQGDAALCLLIKVCDLTVDHRINEGCLIALRNLCTHEPNQTLVAGSDAVTLAVHVCHHSREPCLLTAAATLLTALGFSCPTNKSIIGDAGGLPALLAIVERYLTSRSGNHDTANYHSDVGMTVAVEEACRALGSLLLHEGSRISMQKLGGLKLLANLVMETTEELGVLQTSAMPFCAMCPTAEERYHAHDEGRRLDYMVGVLDVLTVIRNSLASKRKQPPVWVDDAIDILSLDEDGLLRAKLAAQEIMPSDIDIVEEKGVHDLDGDVSSSEEGQTNTGRVVEKPLEFFTRLSLFEERESLVMADHVVTTSLDLESLLFQVF